MDEGSARAVRTAFKRLYDDGLAYRAEALVNWCPGCRTSISDLEMIATPETGTLWTIRYHLVDAVGRPDPDAWISVATTRPETILGDTAVAVHPEDERYRALVGRRVLIPFVERVVPVIADDVVERGFGTGAVKITPAHDHGRLRDGQAPRPGRHHGHRRRGRINDRRRSLRRPRPLRGAAADPGRPRGDGRPRGFVARTRWSSDTASVATTSSSRVSRRSGSSDVEPLAAKALAAVRDGRVRILPARFEKVFFHWLENIHDWNVSRQLWWGHRIPAWYCPDGHVTVSDRPDGPTACGACGRHAAELSQDPDIFDTWFSSGLWPFSTLGWPERTPDLERFYPGTVMETGLRHPLLLGRPDDDARRVAASARRPSGPSSCVASCGTRTAPRCPRRRATSIDPLATIDEIGADALRFALVHGIAPGSRRAHEPRPSSRAPATSATSSGTRHVSCSGRGPRRCPPDAPLTLPPATELGPAEQWILGRCAATIEAVDRGLRRLPVGRGDPPAATRPSGASTATGTWSWPRPAWPTRRRLPRRARRRGGRWPGCSNATCGCSIR